jgi:hypothetical protein
MKRNLLRPLTRPVRSPLHSSSVCSQRIECVFACSLAEGAGFND